MARLFAAILALLALMAPATAENVPPFLTQYEIAVEGSPKFRGSLTIAHVVECQGQSTSRHYLLEDRHMGDRVVIVEPSPRRSPLTARPRCPGCRRISCSSYGRPEKRRHLSRNCTRPTSCAI